MLIWWRFTTAAGNITMTLLILIAQVEIFSHKMPRQHGLSKQFQCYTLSHRLPQFITAIVTLQQAHLQHHPLFVKGDEAMEYYNGKCKRDQSVTTNSTAIPTPVYHYEMMKGYETLSL